VLSLTAAASRIVVGFIDQVHQQAGGGAYASTFSTALTPVGDVALDDGANPGRGQIIGTDVDVLALWAHGAPPNPRARIAVLDPDGSHATIGEMADPVTGLYRYLSPATWNGDHVVVLWDRGASTGVTLSRHAPNGERQGAAIDLPTASPARRLYVTAHDGTVGFTWTEEVGGGYQAYFQQARSCP
jgi:hypothetical protein